MRHPHVRLSLVLAAVAASGLAAAGQDPAARIDEIVREELTRQRIPGAAVAVIRKGETIKAAGYGLANVEHDVPVTPETIFQSGSVGKQFTAALVMLLVQDGKLSLDDTLGRFFPEAPAAWQRIRVRHLLTHTSGLPDYTSGTIDYRRDYTEEELASFAYGLTLEFEPGSRWNYSNTGYVLLGILVRKATGRFYGDVLRDRVFEPLGMKTARVITEEDIVKHRAAGYERRGAELKNQDWVAPRLNTTADGSLYLSLRDMIAWDAGVRAGSILRPETWKQVFAPVTLNSGKTYPYGFGWSVDTFAGRPSHRHGGGWQGFRTDIVRYPADDLTVIVLANLAQADPARIADRVAAAVDPTLVEPERSPAPPDAAAERRLREMLAAAAAGTLSPADLAYVRAGFFPGRAAAYSTLLRNAGAPTGLTLVDRRELGDDVATTWDVQYASLAVRVRMAVAPDGKLAAFDISPRERR